MTDVSVTGPDADPRGRPHDRASPGDRGDHACPAQRRAADDDFS